jgi:hypothetical protein
MTTGIEAVGEAVTGSMFARATEPTSGEAVHGQRGPCLNCGAPLEGAYCGACGQKGHVHRSVKAILHDLVHGVLHLDGKFWRTLPLLLFRPGELTRRYVHGERARFVSPLAMFLFSVFAMFAVLSVFGLSLSNIPGMGMGARQGMEAARQATREDLAEARQRRAELARVSSKNAGLEVLDRQIAELTRQDAELRRLQGGFEGLRPRSSSNKGPQTGWLRLDKGIQKISENPGLALYKMQANSYKFSWLLIPLSVPFVWLLFFWTRRFRIYDHTVFVTYSLSFMSLLAIAVLLMGFGGVHVAIFASIAIFVPLIHMYAQLRGAYQIGRIGALLRTILLASFGITTFSVFFTLLIGIGALG